MAKRSSKETEANHTLPLSTQIEVICINGERIIKNIMSFEDALKIEKKSGWTYKNYQLEFSSFPNTKTI